MSARMMISTRRKNVNQGKDRMFSKTHCSAYYTLLSCTITCFLTNKQGEKENERLVGYNHNYSFVNLCLLRTSSHLSSLASETSHTLLSPLSSHSTNNRLAPSSHWSDDIVLSFPIHAFTYLCNELIY